MITQQGQMNPEVKVLWLEALRSGKYHHAKGRLKTVVNEGDIPKHCCLGVLCELYNEKVGKGTWELHSGILKFDVGSEIRGDFPPSEVLRWAGLSNMTGSFMEDTVSKSLAGINDRDETEDYSKVIEMIEKYF